MMEAKIPRARPMDNSWSSSLGGITQAKALGRLKPKSVQARSKSKMATSTWCTRKIVIVGSNWDSHPEPTLEGSINPKSTMYIRPTRGAFDDNEAIRSSNTRTSLLSTEVSRRYLIIVLHRI
jgi:hypothetical protein